MKCTGKIILSDTQILNLLASWKLNSKFHTTEKHFDFGQRPKKNPEGKTCLKRALLLNFSEKYSSTLTIHFNHSTYLCILLDYTTSIFVPK